MKLMFVRVSIIVLLFMQACGSSDGGEKPTTPKHHLNIPDNGIEAMMESNSSKIIEGNEGSVIITVGEISRKKADIGIKRNDRILDEQLISEGESINFDYEGITYCVTVKQIKKPLIGAGKAEITISRK